ncbi:MAG TPA: hypothetical protein VEV81_07485 [Pyrinomonadaceae bacterium]|nr:hypothetical protein [Pyrinomonadaceae bacterium]
MGCNKGGALVNRSDESRNTTSTPAATEPRAGGSANANLPVADATAFRDRLLELAKNAKFDAQASTSYKNVDAIKQAWQSAYPGLKYTLFKDQAAAPDTVSVGDAFLIARANYDQLLAFAVTDTKGNCAAGAAIIPAQSEYKVSEEKVPTVFKTIEMPGGKTCSGDTAGENYKP